MTLQCNATAWFQSEAVNPGNMSPAAEPVPDASMAGSFYFWHEPNLLQTLLVALHESASVSATPQSVLHIDRIDPYVTETSIGSHGDPPTHRTRANEGAMHYVNPIQTINSIGESLTTLSRASSCRSGQGSLLATLFDGSSSHSLDLQLDLSSIVDDVSCVSQMTHFQ